MAKLEYSAGMVSQLFWFLETKKTVELMNKRMSENEIRSIVFDENLYALKAKDRQLRAFNTIYKRVNSLPLEIISIFSSLEVQTQKLLILISVMRTDLLFFEFVYEVYRGKLILGEKTLDVKDLNVFFDNKLLQSDVMKKWSDSGISKLKQSYAKYLAEAGLISGTRGEREITHARINYKIKDILLANNFDVYIDAIEGEK